jgi:hypothetical protein
MKEMTVEELLSRLHDMRHWWTMNTAEDWIPEDWTVIIHPDHYKDMCKDPYVITMLGSNMSAAGGSPLVPWPSVPHADRFRVVPTLAFQLSLIFTRTCRDVTLSQPQSGTFGITYTPEGHIIVDGASWMDARPMHQEFVVDRESLRDYITKSLERWNKDQQPAPYKPSLKSLRETGRWYNETEKYQAPKMTEEEIKKIEAMIKSHDCKPNLGGIIKP